MSVTHVYPVACHRDVPEQLLLKDRDGTWFLWLADGTDLIDIPHDLAVWMYARPELMALPQPRMWFHPSALPLAGSSTR